jgi:ATP-dependent RNA helicase DeaD
MTSFTSFGLPSFLNTSLDRMGITLPTPIQQKAIPAGLEGRDILGSAQTGTGKTMAYLIPLITNLLNAVKSTALIMAPTRELAAQIQDAARKLHGKKLDMVLLIGGDSMGKQLSALRKHPRVIVGTPGRINDHLTRGSLRLNETRFLVLDETDRMLDMGFSDVLKKIVQHLPKERQTFMFSATMPPSIKTLSLTYLTNPQHISVGSTTQPVLKIKQEMLQTSSSEKFPCLLKELNEREGSVIIFVKTKHGADRLAEKLSRENHHATAIHGDLKQRKREEVIRDFRNLTKRIMVATDIAARGLDIPHIKHVINYDLPQCPEDYIHRIGRTGRAGMEGYALSLVSPDENNKWRRIHKLIETGEDDPSLTTPEKSKKKSKPRPYQNTGPSKFGSTKREGSHPFGSKKDDGRKKSGFPKRGSSKPAEGRTEKNSSFAFKKGAPKRALPKRRPSQREAWAS